MNTRFITSCALVLVLQFLAGIGLQAQVVMQPNPSEQVVINATNVLAQTMTMQSGIPQNLLAGAHGVGDEQIGMRLQEAAGAELDDRSPHLRPSRSP